jgi:class 3 adenylate cyclase
MSSTPPPSAASSLESIDSGIYAIRSVLDAMSDEMPTLRDRFAMAFVAGIGDRIVIGKGSDYPATAGQAYAFADAMLAAREAK